MKKIFSVLLVIVLTVVSFGFANGEASAATSTSRSVSLTSSEPTDSTTRLVANSVGSWSVVNTGNYNISFRVFKNGVAIGSGAYTTVAPGARNTTNFSTTAGAEYSLRLYCNSSSGTGCSAAGVITNYRN